MTNFGYTESNLIRSFPFINNKDQVIPDWLVVDFRALIISGSYDPSKHKMWLAWVGRLNQKLRLGFRTDAPDLADEELIFDVDLTSQEMKTVYAESQALTASIEDRCGCDDELLCDPGFNVDEQCGPELLCDPRFALDCGDNLLCDLDEPPL